MIKKLILIFVLMVCIQTLTKAETYSCSYKWNDEIRTTVDKRTGNTFTTIRESGLNNEWDDVIELNDRIILIDSIDSVFMKVFWKEKKTFSMVGLSSHSNKKIAVIDGTCRVLE